MSDTTANLIGTGTARLSGLSHKGPFLRRHDVTRSLAPAQIPRAVAHSVVQNTVA
jgi:hypothetical protein